MEDPLVFYASSNQTKSYVHLDLECLEDMMERMHSVYSVVELTREQLVNHSVRFCKKCCPEQLRPQSVDHQLCLLCGQTRVRPCPHNGGVSVLIHSSANGIPWWTTRWRWPENVLSTPLAAIPRRS
jgi:hypothetical protein